jgi:hypothetical protein
LRALISKINPKLKIKFIKDDFYSKKNIQTSIKKEKRPLPPELEDLTRLHWLVLARKAINTLEFGSGFSTIFIADAKSILNKYFGDISEMRSDKLFHLYTVGENKNFINITKKRLPKNLKKHGGDKRQYIYTKEQFEKSITHDKLWNSAQKELVITGRMHNYMRMLWGKKVIEWSESYEEAFSILEEFNNKYAYDGRNPNSYSGILWCFGLFDRPWFPERPIFGNLRYMSSDSTMRKFKMNEYLHYVSSLEGNKETLFD